MQSDHCGREVVHFSTLLFHRQAKIGIFTISTGKLLSAPTAYCKVQKHCALTCLCCSKLLPALSPFPHLDLLTVSVHVTQAHFEGSILRGHSIYFSFQNPCLWQSKCFQWNQFILPRDFHKIKSWLSRKKFKSKLFNPKAKSIARNPTLSFRKSLVKEIPKSIFIKKSCYTKIKQIWQISKPVQFFDLFCSANF